MSKTPNLLHGHRFFVTFCYLPDEQIKLRSLLELNGGTVVESVQDADYIVTDAWEFEDKEDVSEGASLVTVRYFVMSSLLVLTPVCSASGLRSPWYKANYSSVYPSSNLHLLY